MAIKNIIANGIGFGVANVNYIPTAGFDSAAPPPPSDVTWANRQARILGKMDLVKHPFITRNY